MIDINLYHNASEFNKVTKTLNLLDSLECELKTEVNLINPVILLTGIDEYIDDLNYVYIPEFNRYYFVQDIKVVRTDLWEISLKVDVLMSFKDEILSHNALIDRQEYTYNPELQDNRINLYQKEYVQTIASDEAFDSFSLVLPILGN